MNGVKIHTFNEYCLSHFWLEVAGGYIGASASICVSGYSGLATF